MMSAGQNHLELESEEVEGLCFANDGQKEGEEEEEENKLNKYSGRLK